MTSRVFANLEREIARTRVALSLIAIGSVYLDPTTPQLGVVPVDGALGSDAYAFVVLAMHLAYGIAVLRAVGVENARRERVLRLTSWLDVAFGGAVAVVTEGATSPARVFFAFAVIAVACRSGFRAALATTLASCGLYLGIVGLAPHSAESVYAMRSFYLAVTGYLIGYLAQQRLDAEAQVRDLETAAERQGIARSLHDGYVQALAGVSLRLDACRELLRRERPERALAELGDLQHGIQREYEEVRAYVRSLAELESPIDPSRAGPAPSLDVEASFRCDAAMAEHVLLIMLEGVRNVRRHAGAMTAAVSARDGHGGLRIRIRDDGAGFPQGASTPWSIASRVAELGGDVQVSDGEGGAHLLIEIPTA
ncbi:MAG TPA: histidine kinase [Candidatus Binatia bacterium]|jgi:signal transduction histidine kinase